MAILQRIGLEEPAEALGEIIRIETIGLAPRLRSLRAGGGGQQQRGQIRAGCDLGQVWQGVERQGLHRPHRINNGAKRSALG